MFTLFCQLLLTFRVMLHLFVH